MNTELATIFPTGEDQEFTCFNSATPCVDITDWPLTPTLIGPGAGDICSKAAYYCTQSISETGYFEIQFMLANNFWGVNMNFGNNSNGTQIRQGIAHLVDKVSFTNSQPNIAGHSRPIDNPLPQNNDGLPTPNACLWDASFPETGPNCVVGASSGTAPATPITGGTAYHLAASTFNNGFAFNQPGLTSPDFCAAAAHFINAGLATGTVGYGAGAPSAATCKTAGASGQLTGIAAGVTAHTVNFFIRIDNNARFQLGQSVGQEICALFTGAFTQPCAPYLTVTPGPITAFPGFITSPTSVNLSWHIYTAGYGNVFPFDSSLFFIYNSRFVSGFGKIAGDGGIRQVSGGFCNNASVGSFSASNYMYLCNLSYDAVSSAMETAPGLNGIGVGDPTPQQIIPRYGPVAGTGTDSIVNATATATTFSGQPVLYGPTPPIGAALVPVPLGIWLTALCDPANTLYDTTPANVGQGGNPGPAIPAGAGTVICFDTGTSVAVPGGGCAGTLTPVTAKRLADGALRCLSVLTVSTQLALNWEWAPGCVQVDGCIQLLYGPGSVDGLFLGDPPSYLKCFCAVSSTVNPGKLSAISAGYQSEDRFGLGAYTIPIFIQLDIFGYLSNWSRVINSAGSSVPQFFTWLNAWSATPTQSGTIRQGFKQNIKSVSPFIESTVWDAYVFGNVYDSLGVTNPANNAQILNWMGVVPPGSTAFQTFSPANAANLGYTPPTGTTAALRISLRGDIFWQNDNSGSHPAKLVSAYDVAFSYLSLLGTGAFNSGGASPTTGITVINQSTFDLDLNSLGSFTTLFETGLPIIPGQYWSGSGQSAWNTAVDSTISTCSNQPTASQVIGCFRAQYTLSPTATIGTSTIPAVACADSAIFAGASGCSHVSASLLNVDTTKIGATYDPVASGILIGSGPWEAVTNGVVGGGTGVTPCGSQVCSTTPTYTLQRYGSVASITASGCGVSDHYFRSNCTLAIWAWTNDNGLFSHDFTSELQVIRACNGITPVPAQCVKWTKGIVGTGGTAIGSVQIGAVNRFVAVDWVGPFDWSLAPPTGLVAFPPVLYDGPTTILNPCSIDPTNGYDC
jgi:hypothetical protein